MTRVTAYIPAYNVSEYLARTIEGLLAQTHRLDEILVIDDGSRDDSAKIASRYPEVTLIQHPVNKGLAAARNTALRAARNEFVASVDADVVADPNWIATLLPHLADPKVAGAGGILIEGVQTTLADRWRRARMAQEWGAHYIRNPRFLYGCNNVFRKSAILEAGATTNRCASVVKTRILPSGFGLEVGILSTIPRLTPRICAMTTGSPFWTCTGAGGNSAIRRIPTASPCARGWAMRFSCISDITFSCRRKRISVPVVSICWQWIFWH